MPYFCSNLRHFKTEDNYFILNLFQKLVISGAKLVDPFKSAPSEFNNSFTKIILFKKLCDFIS